MNLGFEVTELPPATDAIEEGEQAPDFTRPLVNADYWEDVSLSDLLEEGPVVLVFHPMDGDFPSTYTWQEIRDREWTDWDVSVVGVSISTPYEHKGFLREWTDFEQFRLFSDPDCGVGELYGLDWDLDGMAITEHRPAIYVIDEDGVVQYRWLAEEWPEFPVYSDVEEPVESL